MALTTGEMSAKELKCALEQEKADFSPQSLREAKRALDDAVSSGEAEAIDNRRLAWATVLLASPDDAEVEKGLGTCLELADSKYVQEEALYRVAVGSWRMGDFEQSKAYLGELLQINPQHRAAVAFIGVYEESMWHHGLQGAAIVVGVIAVLGLGWYFWRQRGTKGQRRSAAAAPYLGGGYYYRGSPKH